MERQEKIVITNMCMIYDNQGNVVVEDKVVGDSHGLIFPGGHVEEREPIADSVIREVFEETGLTIKNPQLCGVKDWVQQDGSRYMVFLYKASEYSGSLVSSREGEVFWCPLKELKERKLLWHLELMLEIFCTDSYSELFFDKAQDYVPSLK